MGRPAAPAGCFTGRAGFILSDRLATHNLRFEAEPGSTLRLTAHSFAVQRSPAFARAFHPDRPRFPCFVTSARQTAATYLTSNYMATSFQIAGKARLNLTNLKTQNFRDNDFDIGCHCAISINKFNKLEITVLLILPH